METIVYIFIYDESKSRYLYWRSCPHQEYIDCKENGLQRSVQCVYYLSYIIYSGWYSVSKVTFYCKSVYEDQYRKTEEFDKKHTSGCEFCYLYKLGFEPYVACSFACDIAVYIQSGKENQFV